jgi:hypothetical protein
MFACLIVSIDIDVNFPEDILAHKILHKLWHKNLNKRPERGGLKHGCLLCLLAAALQEQNQSTAISNRPLDSSAGCSLAEIPNRLELLN